MRKLVVGHEDLSPSLPSVEHPRLFDLGDLERLAPDLGEGAASTRNSSRSRVLTSWPVFISGTSTASKP